MQADLEDGILNYVVTNDEFWIYEYGHCNSEEFWWTPTKKDENVRIKGEIDVVYIVWLPLGSHGGLRTTWSNCQCGV